MRIPRLVSIVLIVTATTMTGFWLYASRATGGALDRWIAEEAEQGRVWTCPERSIAGFPFALDVTCDHPTFVGRVLDDHIAASLGAVHARATLFDPYRASVTLRAPFTYRTDDGTVDFTVQWSNMDMAIGGLPARVGSVRTSGTDIALKGRFGDAGAQETSAQTGDVTIHHVRKADVPTVEFTIAFGGAAVPALDQFLGGTDKTAVAIAGRLTQAVFYNAPSSAALIDHWRQGKGQITFWQGKISRGSSMVEANGPLHLDEQHKVAGTLDASFTGLTPILRQYGINPAVAHAGALLNSLFGKADPAKHADPDTIQLPITFKDGHLGVGPVMTPIVLAPIY